MFFAPGCAHMVACDLPPRGPAGDERGGVDNLGKENLMED